MKNTHEIRDPTHPLIKMNKGKKLFFGSTYLLAKVIDLAV